MTTLELAFWWTLTLACWSSFAVTVLAIAVGIKDNFTQRVERNRHDRNNPRY